MNVVYQLTSYGRVIQSFSSLEQAKEAAEKLLETDRYEPDDFYWQDYPGYRSICYSNLYIDTPENDVYQIEVVKVE